MDTINNDAVTLKERIEQLVYLHGSLDALASNTGLDVAYLSRLMDGEKVRPGKPVLSRLGLRRVIKYEVIDEQDSN